MVRKRFWHLVILLCCQLLLPERFRLNAPTQRYQDTKAGALNKVLGSIHKDLKREDKEKSTWIHNFQGKERS
jgi:hypothetical protein